MVRLTDRDRGVIAKCSVCRWLTTTQIRRLYFPQATANAVQKRLRKLVDAGYLRTHRPDLMSESLHAAGPKGRAIVEERGLEAATGNDVPRQIEHLVGVNDIRVAVETAAIPVSFFFAHWQLANLGWNHQVIPDAVFALKPPARRTFLLEYDRGTESFEILKKKFRSYAELADFPFDAVLVVTEEAKGLPGFSRKVRKENLAVRIFAAARDEVCKAGLLAPVFVDAGSGERSTLLDLSRASAEEDDA